jgi:FMN phosphatase YigB (HAD superfamily)
MRNVIFDLGGVVLEWNPDAILEGYYTDPQERATMKAALFKHPDWLQMDRGTLTESEALARLQQRTGRPVAELSGLFDAVRSYLRPKADTVALLKSLARRDVPLYCLSNMPASTFAYLRGQHEFWDAFRGIVISGEIKMAKPEREIFEYLLRRYALAAAETVFVDDHAPNIQAAQTLGLHTVWFRDARQCALELERLLAADPPPNS